MLSVKNLVKVYQTKGGVAVRALDGVNIDFADKGMVFLLGKSGSGKSTLLNVTGGLDVPTEGEVVVEGKSSNDFHSQDWDGYRNTFIGFIFQEYNILEEFTVGQNIALALQLQNKPSDEKEVDKILSDVDLSGYAKRKPNTLSGGQRQRVAIARALIKSPRIIMADEPTGALDSETGKQIFETLKKLSKERLVIVVSHDRDFAEAYADRIIELEDGKIISDVTREAVVSNEDNVSFHDNETVTVKSWSGLTKEDLDKIISFMSKSDGETVITKNREGLSEVKKIVGVKDGGKTVFGATKQVDNSESGNNGESLTLIRSKLPMKNALKMAFGNIKAKPIRLAFTILLSLVAFILFGVSTTLMLYDVDYSIATAINASNYDSYVLHKKYNVKATENYYKNGELQEGKSYFTDLRALYTEEEIDELNENNVGLNFVGVFQFGQYNNYLDKVNGYTASVKNVNAPDSWSTKKYYFPSKTINGYVDAGEQFLTENGFVSLGGGRYPVNASEVAIPKYIYDMYRYATWYYNPELGIEEYKSPEDFIGQTIKIGSNKQIELTVTGIYDVGTIPEEYQVLFDSMTSGLSPLENRELSEKFNDYLSCSFHRILFVTKDFYELHKNDGVAVGVRNCSGMGLSTTGSFYGSIEGSSVEPVFTRKSIWQYDSIVDFYDINGNPVTYEGLNLQKMQGLVSVQRLSMQAYELKNKVEDNPDFAEFCSAVDRRLNNKSVFNKGDMAIIIKTLVESFEQVVGRALSYGSTIYAKNASGETAELKVIGFYDITNASTSNVGTQSSLFLTDEFCDEFEVVKYREGDENIVFTYETEYNIDLSKEKYAKVISIGDRSVEQTYFVLEKDGVVFNIIDNNTYVESLNMARMIDNTKPLFYILSGLFGIFASLMMFNFITVSISSKTKEIGILRAVGARGLDVFKIFITEALIITGICFIFSAVLSGVVCGLVNTFLMNDVIRISVLNYGAINVVLLFLVSSLVSFFATVFPVARISKKSPVDSIRSL